MYVKKQRVQIYQLMKLITSTVIGTGEYHLLCSNVLKQHIIRVNYQTLIWRKCLDNFMVLNQPWETGWFIKEEKLDVKWMICNPPP